MIHLHGCQDIAIRDHGAGHPGLCVRPEIIARDTVGEHLRFTGERPERWNVHQPERGFREADEQFALLLLLGWIEQTRRGFEGVLRRRPLPDGEEAFPAFEVQFESFGRGIRVRRHEIHGSQRHLVPVRRALERQRRDRMIAGPRGVIESLLGALVYGRLCQSGTRARQGETRTARTAVRARTRCDGAAVRDGRP